MLPCWLLTLPPVECGKSGRTGETLVLFLELELLLPDPAVKAAPNAPFVPFTGALALDVFRPNAVEAPSKATLREAVEDEELELLLAKVRARAVRDGLRCAAIGASRLTGESRDHGQNERELSKQ